MCHLPFNLKADVKLKRFIDVMQYLYRINPQSDRLASVLDDLKTIITKRDLNMDPVRGCAGRFVAEIKASPCLHRCVIKLPLTPFGWAQ